MIALNAKATFRGLRTFGVIMDIRALLLRAAIGCTLLIAAAAPVCAQTPGAAATGPGHDVAATAPQAANGAADYILGPEDVIEVDVVGRQDFQARVKIATDGTVQLPYLGAVSAVDKTTEQLSAELVKSLVAGGYFAKPIIRVDIVAYASKYVTVLGEVTSPGLVPIDRPYHLSEILARVGGTRESAADYVIDRPATGAEKRFLIRDLATGDAAQDPMVSPGDKIYSPTAEVFFISGEVKAPGSYPSTSDMTVRMAIARGGGLTDLGTDHGVKITRGGVKLSHVDLDSKIQPADVIVIGQRLF
jgi:polysaccharide export outer membrane protein